MQKIFVREKMPEEWRDCAIVPIFKEKGDIQDCGNYIGINMINYHIYHEYLVEELEESEWSVVRQENEREDQWEGVQNSGKASTDVRGRVIGVEEGIGNEIGGRRNENATMDARSYEAGQDQK